ncbi:DUF262 domain-containing protein [Macrococcoides goetzii]|uniref:DUF262 domain-containing protein n=1 Tax=Macrococcoides goetzii TaxID=1891097 RepID=A0A395GA57_9STAP|nr:DUF262 domain-containing protein [Macrococcus goetzii]RAI80627.1 DUF262 domain-containing protein [Macrococcus goetzii]
MKNNKMTFLTLLNNYHLIEIPALQRDFAFGREDTKTKEKRIKFIKSIKNILVSDEEILHLDFIYGKTIDHQIFVPLDGQQRLTMLFLIHLYIAKQNNDVQTFERLRRFSYNTRMSSRDFCHKLIDEHWVNDNIFKQPWFYSNWKKDSTIRGMVQFIISLQDELFGIDFSMATERLERITFTFLDVDNLGSPEELYIKMNSRGKPLSDWDILKSEIIENAEDKEAVGLWLDQNFTDFMFKINSKTYEVDESNRFEGILYRFFKNIIELEEINQSKKGNNIDIITVFNNAKSLIEFIKNKEEEIEKDLIENQFIVESSIKDLLDILIKEKDLESSEKELLNIYYHFAIYKKPLNKDDMVNLVQCLRIIRNIQESYRNQNDIMIESIKGMTKAINSGNILEYFKSTDLKDLKFGSHSAEQVAEERLKAKLITENNEIAKTIYEIEKHPYLSGMIGFLLLLAAKDAKSLSEIEYTIHLEKQLKYTYQLFKSRFNENGIINKKDMLRLIHKYNILLSDHFPHNNGDIAENMLRDKSWKKFFRKVISDDEQYLNAMRTLLFEEKQQDNFMNENEELKFKWFILSENLIEIIGKIKEKYYDGKDYLAGIDWSQNRFTSKIYDIPLYAIYLRNKHYLEDDTYWLNKEGKSYLAVKESNIIITYNYKDNVFIVKDGKEDRLVSSIEKLENIIRNA